MWVNLKNSLQILVAPESQIKGGGHAIEGLLFSVMLLDICSFTCRMRRFSHLEKVAYGAALEALNVSLAPIGRCHPSWIVFV